MLLILALDVAAAPMPPGLRAGECGSLRPAVLHCGVAGERPRFQSHIDCGIYVCMEAIAPVPADAVWLLDEKGTRVPGKVLSGTGGVSFVAAEPLAPGRYELVLLRRALRGAKGGKVSVNNAEEGPDRYRFCFDADEDPRLRNNPSDTANHCERERERRARRPPFLEDARFIEVRFPGVPRVDRLSAVKWFVEESVDWDAPVDFSSSNKLAATLSFLDARERTLETATLDCADAVCFPGGKCFRGARERLRKELPFPSEPCGR
jgi:hypothetical protein